MIKGTKVIVVKDLIKVRKIEQKSKEKWIKIVNAINDNINYEDLVVDFSGVIFKDPSRVKTIQAMLNFKNIRLILMDGPSVNSVRAYLVSEKICSIEEAREKVQRTKTERKRSGNDISISNCIDKLISTAKVKDGTIYMDLSAAFKSVNGIESLKAIKNSIDVAKQKGFKSIVLCIGELQIGKESIEKINEGLELKRKDGTNIILMTDSESTQKLLKMDELCRSTAHVKREEKIKILKEQLIENGVYMIHQYRRTRSIDKYGREGEGQIMNSRPALFLGWVGEQLKFRIFTYDESFCTSEQAEVNGLDESDKLNYIDVIKGVEMIGFKQQFIGRQYHIMELVQVKESESIKYQYYDRTGEVQTKYLVIPEFVKKVFDEFGVNYDEKMLKERIDVSKYVLARNKEKGIEN